FEYSEWIISCSSCLTSVWKPRVSVRGVSVIFGAPCRSPRRQAAACARGKGDCPEIKGDGRAAQALQSPHDEKIPQPGCCRASPGTPEGEQGRGPGAHHRWTMAQHAAAGPDPAGPAPEQRPRARNAVQLADAEAGRGEGAGCVRR